MITEFRGEHYFLNNSYPCSIEYEGCRYNSSESLFQALKSFDVRDRVALSRLSPEDAIIYSKRMKVREDWEEIKVDIMYYVLLLKFNQNPNLMKELLETEGEIIFYKGDVESSWGASVEECNNELGSILMQIREDELRTFRINLSVLGGESEYVKG